jgi:hypothetical protein
LVTQVQLEQPVLLVPKVSRVQLVLQVARKVPKDSKVQLVRKVRKAAKDRKDLLELKAQ